MIKNLLKTSLPIMILNLSTAFSQGLYDPQVVQLKCSYEYDSESAYVEDEVQKTFTAKKRIEGDKVIFSKKVRGIEGYSTLTPNVVADWTDDAEIHFEAILENNIMTYEYKVMNIVTDKDIIEEEYYLKSSIDLTSELEDEDSYVTFEMKERNSVNLAERGVYTRGNEIRTNSISIDECDLYLESEKEEDDSIQYTKKELRKLKRKLKRLERAERRRQRRNKK